MLHIERAVIEGEGLDVVTATSGREAIKALADNSFALIIMDILMPGHIGSDALFEKMRQLPSPPPVIVVSAYWDADPKLREFFGSRAAACLTKPFDINIFRETIRRLVGINT